MFSPLSSRCRPAAHDELHLLLPRIGATQCRAQPLHHRGPCVATAEALLHEPRQEPRGTPRSRPVPVTSRGLRCWSTRGQSQSHLPSLLDHGQRRDRSPRPQKALLKGPRQRLAVVELHLHGVGVAERHVPACDVGHSTYTTGPVARTPPGRPSPRKAPVWRPRDLDEVRWHSESGVRGVLARGAALHELSHDITEGGMQALGDDICEKGP